MSRSIVAALLIVGFILTCMPASAEDKSPQLRMVDRGTKFQLLGRLDKPFGSVLKVQGVVWDGRDKADPECLFRVQRINGAATQKCIDIDLQTIGILDPKSNATYEFEGFEGGEFRGIPMEVFERKMVFIQTSGFGFHHTFQALRADRIKAIEFAPSDFVDREALLQGNAISRDGKAYIANEGWELLVNPKTPWNAGCERKLVEGLGVVRQSKETKAFSMDAAKTRLVRLEDQLHQQVELRGHIAQVSGKWCFEYRGTRMYVDGLDDMPEKKRCYDDGQALVTGSLEEAVLPELDWTSHPKMLKQYVVRKATCRQTSPLLSVETPME